VESRAGFACIASEITDRLALERELVLAKEQAEQSNMAKSEFLSRMSHEMRTPLNAIIGLTTIARGAKGATPATPARGASGAAPAMEAAPAKGDIQSLKLLAERLDKINDASNHLLGVINDILDMSKIESGKFLITPNDFSIENMLNRVVNVLTYRIDEKDIVFSMSISPDLPERAVADEQRLAQVLANLLDNAVKFTPPGGAVSLNAELVSEEDGLCVIQFQVSDTGIGISPEQAETLFQSFEQADGSISRRFGGTGLGLSISKRIVELMGGEISVTSTLGQGSVFTFTIKAERGTASSGAQAEEDESDGRGEIGNMFTGKHILLVEDVEINREIVISMLEETGAAIDCAENGRVAIDMFMQNPDVDLILMDVHMPEVDGLEATRCIRASTAKRALTVPIVAMTASVFREDVERCMTAGMNDHIGKPLDFEDTLVKMRKYLRF
jgi:signal transduction histidine kinase/ActR/RegA family two-component response regulator